jgi:hypothetical protein
VKAIRGGGVSGAIVIEGAADAALKAKLSQMMIQVAVQRDRSPMIADGPTYEHAGGSMAKVGADGSFRASGLPPGKLLFYLRMFGLEMFTIVRVERDGAPVQQAIELRGGERIQNVRVIVAQANGLIRGQVRVAGGAPPPGWRLMAVARKTGTESSESGIGFVRHTRDAWADSKGRFLIESLAPGEYDVMITAHVRNPANGDSQLAGAEEPVQRVSVGNGAEAAVTISFDPARRKQEERQ